MGPYFPTPSSLAARDPLHNARRGLAPRFPCVVRANSAIVRPAPAKVLFLSHIAVCRKRESQTMSNQPVIHIVDDEAAIREALALVLTEEFEIRTHASARDFLETVQPNEAGCLITDIRMPEMDGIELLAKMKERRLALPVIVMSGYADIPLAVEAMKTGAIDFLEKPFDDDALLASVRAALIDRSEANSAEAQEILARLATLSKRENDVLGKVLQGQLNKVIAHELGITMRTVEIHRAHIMTKMNARSVAELVRISLTVPRADRN
jgi:two-component system response regulator FixJ